MTGSKRGGRYPAELGERAVRMLFEHQHEYPSQWQAFESIAEKLSIHRETMRTWVRRAEVDAGRRPGPTSDQLEELKLLRRENAELRRANDILKAASAFLGVELDRHSRK
jgi:transposase